MSVQSDALAALQAAETAQATAKATHDSAITSWQQAVADAFTKNWALQKAIETNSTGQAAARAADATAQAARQSAQSSMAASIASLYLAIQARERAYQYARSVGVTGI